MINQYIKKQLEESNARIEKKHQRQEYLRHEEESCLLKIKELWEQQDVGMELFSPRSAEDSTTRREISEIKQRLEEIRLEQKQLSQEISNAKEEQTKYQDMLLEIKKKESIAMEMNSMADKTNICMAGAEQKTGNAGGEKKDIDSEKALEEAEQTHFESEYTKQQEAGEKNTTENTTGFVETVEKKQPENSEEQPDLVEEKLENATGRNNIKRNELDENEVLKQILTKVERCIALWGTDRGKCKNEMVHLKYYIKSIVSQGYVSRETQERKNGDMT